MRNRLFLLAVLSLPACANIGKACTEIGCVSSVTVRFDGVLADGSYTVELAAVDHPPSTCLVLLSGGQAEPASDCELEVAMVSGALEATLFDAPTELVVGLVQIGGDSLVDEVLNPVYETSQPNGEDCPPTCEQALEVIEF
jgi:hypothetical protein